MFRRSVPVLCYHALGVAGGHTLDQFREHLDAITDAGYRTITARELLAVTRGERRIDGRSVVLTFDDCHLSNWLHAVPELEKRGMTGVFFALTDFTRPGAVRTLEDAPELLSMPDGFRAAHLDRDCAQFINESEIRAMVDKGMEVYSHGARHQGCFVNLIPREPVGDPKAHWAASCIYPALKQGWPMFRVGSAYAHNGFWPELSNGDEPLFRIRSEAQRREFCRKDFARSIERMRELNRCSEQLFCWPWGQFDPLAEEELRKAGFAGAFTLERWANTKGTDPYRINRLGVGLSKDGKWVRNRLRMYGNEAASRFFFKLYRKRPEPRSVLYATDTLKVSGGARQMVNNAKAMADMGLKVHAMITPESHLNGELERIGGVNIIHFNKFRNSLKGARFLKEVVGEHGIDVVHSFHNRPYKMGVLARLMGARFKHFINRGVISKPNSIFFLWTALADGVVCNSRKCSEVLARHHVLKSRRNVVYNAFTSAIDSEPQPRKKRSTRILYVGNIAPTKGFDVFTEACQKLCEAGNVKDMEFVAVGILDYMAEDLMQKHGWALARERMHICGPLSHDLTMEQVAAADMLIVPSRLESLPNTILEAFDRGLPVVCTRAGGIPELVRDGVNGFLCEIEDAECIAARMRQLADDPELRHRMGQINRKVVRTLLTTRNKGMNLMRVYMGERIVQELPIEELD
ncbi:glycosyltransferase [Salidesulfovibrio onnuriiensis]|uniref:glycosyltransferase n=1 Tax=Salidesulfovibrio onnuriiensis TaxID=2583823 RepID=UPI0011CC0E87|nr:glycosyltransferase [Salidesulfovibrio onnuriiensis]